MVSEVAHCQIMNVETSLPSKSAPLSAHLEAQSVEFMQFAFRWMNCLLMREITVQNTIRMWDTYLVGLSDALIRCSL